MLDNYLAEESDKLRAILAERDLSSYRRVGQSAAAAGPSSRHVSRRAQAVHFIDRCVPTAEQPVLSCPSHSMTVVKIAQDLPQLKLDRLDGYTVIKRECVRTCFGFIVRR